MEDYNWTINVATLALKKNYIWTFGKFKLYYKKDYKLIMKRKKNKLKMKIIGIAEMAA